MSARGGGEMETEREEKEEEGGEGRDVGDLSCEVTADYHAKPYSAFQPCFSLAFLATT